MEARFYHRIRFDSFGDAGTAESVQAQRVPTEEIFLRAARRLYRLLWMGKRSGFRYLAVPAALFVAVFVLTRGLPWTPMRIAGVALMIPGFVLWGIAHVQLGDSFAIRAEARQLVTRGIYSRFRNPIYLFGGIGIAGLVLAFDRPLWLLAFLVLIPMQIVRSQREARVLEEKFGDEYRQYARKTWL
jgi:protein-S-isoprenylcysteine O-methyltransferase Ste14